MDGLFYFLVYLCVCVHCKVGEHFVCLIADRLTACAELNVTHECQVPKFDTRTKKIQHFPGVVPSHGLGSVSYPGHPVRLWPSYDLELVEGWPTVHT